MSNKSPKHINEIGNKYGKWSVISEAGINKRRRFQFNCECECGTKRVLSGHKLRTGRMKHCGCSSTRVAPNKLTQEEIEKRLKTSRQCHQCLLVFPPEEFKLNPVLHKCRSCINKNAIAARIKNGKISCVASKYGMSEQEYYDLIKSQDSKCLICHEALSNKSEMAIDHDHRFEKKDKRAVRGMICHNCNRGLGSFKDNTVILLTAIKYLKKNNKRLDKLL